MASLNLYEWVGIALGVLVMAGIAWRALGARRHVDISGPELDASVASPTLARNRTIATESAPAEVATPFERQPLIPEIPPDGPEFRPTIVPAIGESDDLTLVKGIGPKLAALLNSLGVRRFDQIAQWSDEDISEVDRYLGTFSGRIRRDHWIDQSKMLAEGDIERFEKRFGKLDKPIR